MCARAAQGRLALVILLCGAAGVCHSLPLSFSEGQFAGVTDGEWPGAAVNFLAAHPWVLRSLYQPKVTPGHQWGFRTILCCQGNICFQGSVSMLWYWLSTLNLILAETEYIRQSIS